MTTEEQPNTWPSETCPECQRLTERRASASAAGDYSGMLDYRILMGRHLKLAHAASERTLSEHMTDLGAATWAPSQPPALSPAVGLARMIGSKPPVGFPGSTPSADDYSDPPESALLEAEEDQERNSA